MEQVNSQLPEEQSIEQPGEQSSSQDTHRNQTEAGAAWLIKNYPHDAIMSAAEQLDVSDSATIPRSKSGQPVDKFRALVGDEATKEFVDEGRERAERVRAPDASPSQKRR